MKTALLALCLGILLANVSRADEETDVVSNLIKQLKDKRPAARRGAAINLGSMGPAAKAAVPALLEALNDDDSVRDFAATALVQIDLNSAYAGGVRVAGGGAMAPPRSGTSKLSFFSTLAAQRGEVYSLAVVITVIVLVLLAWLSFRRAQREWAIGLITSMGGKVHFDKRSKGRPVIAVDLGERTISDNALAYLKKFKDLQAVDLHDTDITDAGLIYLYQLSNLQEVDLHNTQVSEAGIDKLRKMMPRVKIHGWDSRQIEEHNRI